MGKRVTLLLSLLILFLVCSVARSSTSTYFYDSGGRLVRSSVGNIGTSYMYDAVGNIISADNVPLAASVPTVTSVAPVFLIAGCTNLVTINGSGFFKVGTISSGQSSSIFVRSITDSKILLEIIPNQTGTETISLTTVDDLPRHADVSMPSSQITVSTENLAMLTGTVLPVSVELVPQISSDVIVKLTSTDQLVIGMPSGITIPAGGASVSMLTGQSAGVARIVFGDRLAGRVCFGGTSLRAVVASIIQPSIPVSIAFDPSPINNVAVSVSPAISVGFTPLPPGKFSPFSIPVSVSIDPPALSALSAKFTVPVSVVITAPPSAGSAAIVTTPISVVTATSAVLMTTAVSRPVSVSITTTP